MGLVGIRCLSTELEKEKTNKQTNKQPQQKHKPNYLKGMVCKTHLSLSAAVLCKTLASRVGLMYFKGPV